MSSRIDKSRSSLFPSIEKSYGEKMTHWFTIMEKLAGKKYLDQVAYLKEIYGFSQAHANALVMYSRGSESSKRFNAPTDFYKSVMPEQAKTIKAIFKAITTEFPKVEIVIAWNQPMAKVGKNYLFGVSASTNHIAIAPWDQEVLKTFAHKFNKGKPLKKMIQLPNDWEVDDKLIQRVIKASLANIKKK